MMWLEEKAIYMDIEPFVFFVLATFDEKGYQVVGYFSRHQYFDEENLGCFCVFPCYQRRGYGTFLVDFSYMLSRLHGKLAGPERPFSYIGSCVYKKYWRERLLHLVYIKASENGWDNFSLEINDIMKEIGMTEDDVIEAITDACSSELTRVENKVILRISPEETMEIGRQIEEKMTTQLLALEGFLDPSFKESILELVEDE